jgi:Sulfotransferase family
MRIQHRQTDSVLLCVGRGGSGTRLLSQLAVDAGIFIGNELNESGDSLEWVDLIYEMVVQAGGHRALPNGSRYRREIHATADRILAAAPLGRPTRWGMKLPEAMLVLPLLLDAFPNAKVVHLTRHPVPCSLRRTHKTSRLGNRVGNVALPAAYAFAGRNPGQIAIDEVYLHNAYSWNYQVARVVAYARRQLRETRYLEIKYEHVCDHPETVFKEAETFFGQTEQAGSTTVSVDPSRTGSWDPDDSRVRTIWEICGETAAAIGYGATATG